MSDVPIERFIEQLGLDYHVLPGYDIYMVDCGHGMFARCFYVDQKILVMLARSEWVIDTQQEADQACKDIHTFIGNTENG